MALAVVQKAQAENPQQTLTATFGVTPTSGNFLVTVVCHDESSEGLDAGTITSVGWIRLATFAATVGGRSRRISVYAKTAGASEATGVTSDLGEVPDRNTHLHILEYSGFTSTIPVTADAVTNFSSASNDSTPSTIQADAAITPTQFAIMAVYWLGSGGTCTVDESFIEEADFVSAPIGDRNHTHISWREVATPVQPTVTNTSTADVIALLIDISSPPAVGGGGASFHSRGRIRGWN